MLKVQILTALRQIRTYKAVSGGPALVEAGMFPADLLAAEKETF